MAGFGTALQTCDIVLLEVFLNWDTPKSFMLVGFAMVPSGKHTKSY